MAASASKQQLLVLKSAGVADKAPASESFSQSGHVALDNSIQEQYIEAKMRQKVVDNNGGEGADLANEEPIDANQKNIPIKAKKSSIATQQLLAPPGNILLKPALKSKSIKGVSVNSLLEISLEEAEDESQAERPDK